MAGREPTGPDEDKYPPTSDRRRFVKGVVGAAALSGVVTATASAVNLATSPSGQGGGQVQYYGVENVAGPAPRAMPQIPVEVDDEGFLRGLWPEVGTETEEGREIQVARTQLGGVTYSSEWFQYCGVQTYRGIQPGYESDNYFRYSASPPYEWQREQVEGGARVNVSDFEDYETWGNDVGKAGIGKPAMATWRSQDVPASETVPVQIIRSERVRRLADRGEEWLRTSTAEGFVAVMDKCTHFCCVPSFKGTADSAKFGGANEIYCQCHQSVYDPFSVVLRTFTALPRPEDAGDGGAGSGGNGGGGE